MKILTDKYDPRRNPLVGRGFLILQRIKPCKDSTISISTGDPRPARFHWLENSYLAKHRHPACAATPGLHISHRTEDSSATEVIPAVTASPWVSWAPAILRGSAVFGRSLLLGPLLQRIWYKQLICLQQHLPQIFPARSLQPWLLFCLSMSFGEDQWQHPLERETREKESRTARKKTSWPRL